LKLIAAWIATDDLEGIQRDLVAEQPHLKVETMCLPRSIGYLERLELHVGEVDSTRRSYFLIEAPIAQVAVTAFD
jgi:hypothetical protein